MKSTALDVKASLQKYANKKRARVNAWFFKTASGEYGEGDIFIGVTSSDMRLIGKKYRDLAFSEMASLLRCKIHEQRQVALIILVDQFSRADELDRKKIYDFYLKNTRGINNWDLVDLSAYKIVGEYLASKSARERAVVLRALARSKNFWERRIAIIATLAFIKRGQFAQTFSIARILLRDHHDLIHKAVGWMLREVGNRNRSAEEKFLRVYYHAMPRTMLRYAIEKFPESLRQSYLRR